jgi:alkylation response protein AidB-like acyl-CoA dehydrogenase
MDFNLTPEQLLIKDSVARFAADNGGETKRGDHWKTFGELGWLAIGAPEDLGGFGGPIETLLVMEQFGRGLVVSPYVSQVVLAGTILKAADRLDLLEQLAEGKHRFTVAYEEPHARYDPACVDTTAHKTGEGWTLRGTKVRVLDAESAQTLLVSARTDDDGIALFAVPADAPNLRRTPYPAEDRSDVADVTLEDVTVGADAMIGTAGSGIALLELGLDHATAALCAEALGLCSLMLEATVDYTKQRHQFGVALSSFQALQHRMAEMYIELELVRSMAYLAAMTLEDTTDAATRKRGVSAAKAQIAKSARFIGQQAIQLHGGIGMSEEYKVGHYFKRSTLLERLLGDRDFHITRYIALRDAAVAEPIPV